MPTRLPMWVDQPDYMWMVRGGSCYNQISRDSCQPDYHVDRNNLSMWVLDSRGFSRGCLPPRLVPLCIAVGTFRGTETRLLVSLVTTRSSEIV